MVTLEQTKAAERQLPRCQCCEGRMYTDDKRENVFETFEADCGYGCYHEVEHDYTVCQPCYQRCPMPPESGEWDIKHVDVDEEAEPAPYVPPKEQMALPL